MNHAAKRKHNISIEKYFNMVNLKEKEKKLFQTFNTLNNLKIYYFNE